MSGVALDGRTFFYENPLASKGTHHRKGWFDCACCPPNIARLIASIGSYIYSEGNYDAWVHLYMQGEGKLFVGGTALRLRQKTQYPWDGDVWLTLDMPVPATFRLHLRVPGWCQQYQLWVNDFPMADAGIPADGYVHVAREWVPGDVVRLHLEMPVQYVQASPNVQQMHGRVALQRGPVVYCLEGADHEGIALGRVVLRGDVPAADVFTPEYLPEFLGGVAVLHGTGMMVDEPAWAGDLYRARSTQLKPVRLTAVPYYAWDNRAPGEMRVWLRTS
jgi:DUF1680 family protein